jgi:hypothetical protein
MLDYTRLRGGRVYIEYMRRIKEKQKWKALTAGEPSFIKTDQGIDNPIC